MTKRFIAALFIVILGVGSAQAEVSPQGVVKSTSEKMLDALRKNRAALEQDSTKIYGLVQSIVLPNFDFNTMSRWVLGRYWRQATPEQRTRFAEEFRTLLVRTYAKTLLEYSDAKISFPPMPASAAESDDVTVRSEVQPVNGAAFAINYSMHRKGNDWKIYDVTVDGVSLVTNYRGSFASQIRDQGMDAMINKLADLNARGSSS